MDNKNPTSDANTQKEETEEQKRENKAKQLNLNPLETDLFVRYSMDHKVWRAAQRMSGIYNLPLYVIVGGPMVLPLIFLLINRGLNGLYDPHFLTLIQTIIVSISACFLTDKAIESFGDSLKNKGLLGRDLNKAGEQKLKKPV